MSLDSLTKFKWEVQPQAQRLVNELIQIFLARCPQAAAFARRLFDEASCRFGDCVESISVPRTEELRARVLETGFVLRPVPGASDRYEHPGAMFPAIMLNSTGATNVSVKVDFVADFLAAHQVSPETPIEGAPWNPVRRAAAFRGDNATMFVVERHGCRDEAVPMDDARRSVLAMQHLETFRRRRRDWPCECDAFAHMHAIIDPAIRDLGRDFACDLWFHAERDYWERRCRAGQVQHHRQNRLGIGWANHDHHTYRCSRKNFTQVIGVFEKLGFTMREKFFAGAEAGWGAQVIEQTVTGVTIFADVDMGEHELVQDFAHVPMAERDELGTVGLWVALHGEALLEAGMHHLECQFDFDALSKQLGEHGIGMMHRFTNFGFLTQCFTDGEWWPVKESRLQALLAKKAITPEQAAGFRQKGALGSHLENLERNDGYKGFNQQGVSDIIKRTDARLQLQGA